MFKKRRRKDEAGTEAREAEPSGDAIEGTMPDLSEAEPALDADPSGGAPAVPTDLDAVRLFPSFEHEDFEVGFRLGEGAGGGALPALVMRWKEGGAWFRMPAMFNRAVLSAMDERDTGSDLTRLMRSYGYDVA